MPLKKYRPQNHQHRVPKRPAAGDDDQQMPLATRALGLDPEWAAWKAEPIRRALADLAFARAQKLVADAYCEVEARLASLERLPQQPLTELDLGERATNSFFAAGIRTVSQLLACSDAEILDVAMCGPNELAHVDAVLTRYGLRRKASPSDLSRACERLATRVRRLRQSLREDYQP